MNRSQGMRLQKFLSRAGAASRRQAEDLMAQGRVRVNGEPATTLGIRVEPGVDRVELDGKEIRFDRIRWILLNKPRGVLTTRRDPGGRPTVYSLLPPEHQGLKYVGRLDQDTEGLLLFTNDGTRLHALTHPSSEVPREYRALVGGIPDRAVLQRLEQGVELEDGPARAERVRMTSIVEGKGASLSLILREGRKREVKRLFDAVGHSVRRLRRVGFGPIRLGDLRPGEWRELDAAEVQALRRAAGGSPSGSGGETGEPRRRSGGKGGAPPGRRGSRS
jgi:23S rRNA pseudouridine2605 synthase